ncbi:hypothetical protein [Roseateles paludis]|jgi:hypothetical protein|uniref:Uncharacterized protein n=1 Tax=Roseateles paludis TaxID=3145238 RepID=A0ABV0FZ18_9BURK
MVFIPSVVVDDLDIGGAFCRPDEADAPLLFEVTSGDLKPPTPRAVK